MGNVCVKVSNAAEMPEGRQARGVRHAAEAKDATIQN